MVSILAMLLFPRSALAVEGPVEDGFFGGFDGHDPFALVRVDDPDHPDAIVRSATGAVLLGPPASGPWRWEPVAEIDQDTGGVGLSPAFELLDVTNADLWHAEGHRGAGVRIAVFDPGWNTADAEELGAFTTHDCIATATCDVPFDPLRENGRHGVACAEVVRDLAPDAELFLVRTGSFTSFENGVEWAVRNDIDIISMSVSFYNDSFNDGRGPFGPLLERLEAHGVLLVTSAGNTAREHWKGRFTDADADGRMDFDGSNRLEFFAGEGDRRIDLNWDQHADCGTTDLDLVVTDLAGDILGRSADLQLGGADRCAPVERLRFTALAEGRYAIEVHHARGALGDLDLALLARGGQFVDPVREHSVTIPADHPLAVAVGAVRADLYQTAGPEGFSSWGPNNAGHPKPDIAGPNRLSTRTYGPEGFTGTSASTPAVAGLIAIRMSASDDSPRDAFDWLRAHALSDAPAWALDPALGAGRARLPDPRPTPRTAMGCGDRPLWMSLCLPLFLVPAWRRRVRCRR
jgi:subtilisin family serine protease